MGIKIIFLGKSVINAANNINKLINKNIKNLDPNNQQKIDQILIDLDGTEIKKILVQTLY